LITDEIVIRSLKKSKFKVNSYHKQGICLTKLASPLQPFAISEKDKTVEGFFHPVYPIVGIMWHPERNNPSSDLDLAIINRLRSFSKKT
jgi:gamma-glutamyl-gamma-aminobutyrate hydrolase PuuD